MPKKSESGIGELSRRICEGLMLHSASLLSTSISSSSGSCISSSGSRIKSAVRTRYGNIVLVTVASPRIPTPSQFLPLRWPGRTTALISLTRYCC